ncbi:hypothetical protein [Egicoccus halophilus]|uniref:Uncharacterized protein n=1 Tax=Egicoccus halophilus TaxID=1670830 RepID=A0A8J3AGD8_9ACTN|nr:hypothetical protein [Egicoccus halophilus]GGI08797.1 hypothetical protein GCM10011354_30880 [Egicoccus halophilus]
MEGARACARLAAWTLALAAAFGALLLLAGGSEVVGPAVEVPGALTLLVVSMLLVSSPRRRSWQQTGHDRALAAGTAAAIDALDPVEHRSVELGAPWPRLIVGPAGVAIVDVCPPGPPDGVRRRRLPSGRAPTCAGCEASSRAAGVARRLLDEVDGGRQVPVRLLAVVGPASPVGRDRNGAADARVETIRADHLADRLARGPVLPMELVDRTFCRLAGLSGMQAPTA